MGISYLSSDVCSSDLSIRATEKGMPDALGQFGMNPLVALKQGIVDHVRSAAFITLEELRAVFHRDARAQEFTEAYNDLMRIKQLTTVQQRSEEHTSELQSLIRISSAVFCVHKKKSENN